MVATDADILRAARPASDADILRTAAGLIRGRGLAQGQPVGPNGELCSVVAIFEAAGGARRGQPLVDRFRTFLQVKAGVAYWSDGAPDAEFVAEAMEKAAATFEEAGG